VTIQPFEFPATGQQVRVIGDPDNPLIHHGDACKILEHSNPSMAIKLVDDDERKLIDMRDIPAGQTALSNAYPTPATGNGQAWFLTEPGFYSLALRSRAPGARDFRRWITHDVIPSIRRTGRYEAPVLADPLAELERQTELTTKAIAIARQERAGREMAEQQVRELEPAARSWEVLASGDGDFSVGDAAKILSRDPAIRMGRDRLFTVLAEQKWTYRQVSDGRPRAKQTAIECGRLSELPQSHYHPRTGELVLDPPQVRVTVKGVQELHKRLGGQAPIQYDELRLDDAG
jgi:prophage antirepressor-like protein